MAARFGCRARLARPRGWLALTLSGFEYEALAARAFDAPWDDDVIESMRVCADALESRGDPRGALISLGLAPPSREMRLAIAEAGARLLGDLGPIGQGKRGLVVEWRAGSVFGMRVDTRRTKSSPPIIIDGLFATPEIRTLRHLWVRCAPSQVEGLLGAIGRHRARPPLERLVVGATARPRVVRYTYQIPNNSLIRMAYPDLHMFGAQGSVGDIDPPQDIGARLIEIAAVTEMDREARKILGRALFSAPLREAALVTIARLGAQAAPLLDLLEYLLEPGMIDEQAPVVQCVAKLGRHARSIWPSVGAITGREGYTSKLRSLAGAVYRELR